MCQRYYRTGIKNERKMERIKLVLATRNQGKVQELLKMLPKSISLLSLSDINCHEDIPETQDTIEGNALQKALYVKENYGYDCFADDTGLLVDALDGAPGVYSARYAGKEKDNDNNIAKLLKNLEDKDSRKAHFKTAIALVTEKTQQVFEGICEGEITEKPSGVEGFGYDPIFKPENYQLTFSEMKIEAKNKISHRGKALEKLIKFLEGYKV